MNTLDAKALGWGSEESQQKRFQVLSEIGDLKGKIVLDVGCGFGDFYNCPGLGEVLHFTGIDKNPKHIEVAKRRYPAEFYVGTIEGVNGRFDYIFASGIFNLQIWAGREETIKRMFMLCGYGVAFNIHSTKADFTSDSVYYSNPGEMLEFCLALTRKVVLRHDYMTHDFTVYLYKERV